MTKHRMVLAITALLLASMACLSFFGGGGNDSTQPGGESGTNPTDSSGGQGGSSGGGNAATSASGFPLTPDAYNVIDIGDGSVLFYTNMSLDEVMDFYRSEYVSQGYSERGLLTVVSDGTFSMVFDGDPSGKSVVIQSVDLGDGSRTVAIRLEDT